MTAGGHFRSHIGNMKNVYKQLFNAKKDIPLDMFSLILRSGKSNDIANIFVKTILVQKIA